MIDKLNRLRHLSGSERRELVRASVMVPLVGVTLRLGGFRRTYRWLAQLSTAGSQQKLYPSTSSWATRETSEMVALAVRHNPAYRATCLPESLTLWYMLRRNGVPAELRIGVRKTDEQFLAHAWVEQDGQVLNDVANVAQQYAPLDISFEEVA